MQRSRGGPYRAGPWPGLTPTGAGVLLACAAFLAVGQILVGPPMRPVPDLAVTAATALVPAVVAMRITRFPGAASCVCGAYLLPASLLSLLLPIVPTPPLLLVSAVAYDLALWLRADEHLGPLLDVLPGRTSEFRPQPAPQAPTRMRAAVAGAMFGLALALIEPPFRVLLGADPSLWSGPSVWLAAVTCTLSCAVIGTLLTFRGRAA